MVMPTTEAVKPAAKEKKPPSSKSKSPKNASHPLYFEMIKGALLALKEKGGSSPYAISKYIEKAKQQTKASAAEEKKAAAPAKKAKAKQIVEAGGAKPKKAVAAKPKKAEALKKGTKAAAPPSVKKAKTKLRTFKNFHKMTSPVPYVHLVLTFVRRTAKNALTVSTKTTCFPVHFSNRIPELP